MSEFKTFKIAVDTQLASMAAMGLFSTNVSKDDLWDTYIASFPEGTNPIYRERTEHDCSCCKQFIRAAGNTVTILNNELISIWDVEIGGTYQVVADALSALVKSQPIDTVFLSKEKHLGTDHNHEMIDGNSKRWDHFHYELPAKYVIQGESIGTKRGDFNTSKSVFQRALTEITVDAVSTVLELIEQNSLYRGAEHKATVQKFLQQKQYFNRIPAGEQDNYCWAMTNDYRDIARIRNSSIGTLLTDISEGMELDQAVKSFETKVAPENYKRPTALITKGMIDKAQAKVAELGMEDSLARRHAVVDDLTINNVIYADRSAKQAMNVFDELAEAIPDKVKNLDKVDEVSITDFIHNILPKADSIELLFENRHENNLMSLVAPVNADAPNMLKWGNNFSWAYNGDIADSIKDRVKKAGGSVTGDLRCSLAWFNRDDLDIHVKEPCGNRIHFSAMKNHVTGGNLDVDMNAGSCSPNPVENITWPDKAKMREGVYELLVHNYTKRSADNPGFDMEIEFGGTIHSFHYDKAVKSKEHVVVAQFKYTHAAGIEFIKSIPSSKASKEVYEVQSEKFQKVTLVMNSPNHWDGEETGNKHYFFIMDKCKNDQRVRGFFNEFLKNELHEHRKVFEVLGAKMKAEPSDDQLSGLGFSSTQRNHAYFKVTGSFARTVKVTF